MTSAEDRDEGDLRGGGDDEVVRVYREIVASGACSREALALATGLTPDTVDGALVRLAELSLVQRPESTGGWMPLNPRTAIAATLGPLHADIWRRQRDADRLRADLEKLQDIYHDALPEQHGDDPVETLEETTRVRQVLTDAAAQCTVEVLGMHAGGRIDAATVADALARDVQVLQRGVRMRSLLQHSSRVDPVTQAYVRALTAAGGEVRTVDVVVGRLVAFDRKVAFISVTGGRGATIVRQPEVVSYLCDQFEQRWNDASPFGEEGMTPELRDDMRRRLLEMLARGLKDEAIARTMGMSLRTCRRRISEVMEEFGARSRFEAGVKAAQLGLLDTGVRQQQSTPGDCA